MQVHSYLCRYPETFVWGEAPENFVEDQLFLCSKTLKNLGAWNFFTGGLELALGLTYLKLNTSKKTHSS